MVRSRNALGLCLLLLTAGCLGNVVEPDYQLGATPPPLTGADAGPSSDASPQPSDDGATRSDATALTAINDAAPIAPPSSANPCGGEQPPLLADLRIRELSLYQTVKVPLYAGAAWIDNRNASVVQGKKSLLRVFVEPVGSFDARTVRAVLTLDSGGVSKVITVDKAISKTSTDAEPGSTLDFALDGVDVAADTQLSVALIETSCPSSTVTPAAGARLPDVGLRPLHASRIGKLRVVLVPIDLGTGLPDTSPGQIAKIRDNLLAYYPVPDVEVTVHESITWTKAVLADSTGWDALLDQVGTVRSHDATRSTSPIDRDVYYFGLIVPKPSFNDYCGAACVLGLAPLAVSANPLERIGLGVGYIDPNTYLTVVHELGHAHGLRHAPCAPRGGVIDGVDTAYELEGPSYAKAKIGSWGWDSRTNKLLAPTAYTDVMGYCDPTWISDYNFEKLAARSRTVNTAAYIATNNKAQSTVWRRLILAADGSAQWSALSTRETPSGLSWARALDAQGNALAEVQVAVTALSHSGSSFVYLPEPAAEWAAIDVGGRIIDLTDVTPAE